MEDDLTKDRRNSIDYDWVWVILRETEKLTVCNMVWRDYWQEIIGSSEKRHNISFYWATYEDGTQRNNPI